MVLCRMRELRRRMVGSMVGIEVSRYGLLVVVVGWGECLMVI